MARICLIDYPIPPGYCWIKYQLDLRYISLKTVAKKAECSIEKAWYVINGQLPSKIVETVLAELIGYPSWNHLWADASVKAEKDRYIKITRQDVPNHTPPVSEAEEATSPGKSCVQSLSDRTRTESQDRRASQGFLSRVLSRWRCEPAKPSLTMEEFQRMCREGGRRLAEKRKGKETYQALLNNPPADSDQFFDQLAKTYGYRRPWFPQLRDHRKHPILSRLFGFYFYLSCVLTPPWVSYRIIITRKKTKKETE